MTRHPTPADALAAHLGCPVTARPLSDRRGSQTWEITAADGLRLALKADSSGPSSEVTDVARESAVLAQLASASAVSADYLHSSGRWAEGWWIAVTWIDAQPLWLATAPAREADGDRPAVRQLLLRTAHTLGERLAAMHAHGWSHADVQPTNIFTDPHTGVSHLIDYALACGPDDSQDRPPYRGALTHTTPPEIAAAILGTDESTHIRSTAAADVWSLGATLFWCWTGHRPFAYDQHTDRHEKLKIIANRAPRPLDQVRPWPFPCLENLITACLAPSPEDRPSAPDLLAALLEERA